MEIPSSFIPRFTHLSTAILSVYLRMFLLSPRDNLTF